MVYKIVKLEKKYKVFIETLILTILILMIGFTIGFYIEYSRTSITAKNYKLFEVDLLDLELQNYYYRIMGNESCKIAIKSNLDFADRIYSQGLILERYEDANEILEDEILLEKKKYVLLKTELWLNSITIKQRCENPFHTITYIYSQEPNNVKDAEQAAIAETLQTLKKELGNNFILIPIAGDLGLYSIDLQLETYNITYLPSIIIDEEIVLVGYHNEDEIKKFLEN
jgi:hypothetical protein